MVSGFSVCSTPRVIFLLSSEGAAFLHSTSLCVLQRRGRNKQESFSLSSFFFSFPLSFFTMELLSQAVGL
jgi:hypothetical protein